MVVSQIEKNTYPIRPLWMLVFGIVEYFVACYMSEDPNVELLEFGKVDNWIASMD